MNGLPARPAKEGHGVAIERVFAARALDGKKAFVVRGGYRISYYPQKLQDWVGSQSGSVPVGATFSNTVSNTALSPDGLPNYGLRSVPKYIAGVNTPIGCPPRTIWIVATTSTPPAIAASASSGFGRRM